MAHPLHDLLRKETPFVWAEAHQLAFKKLCTAFSSAPILAFPDFSRPFIVDTDACVSGLGAVLSQVTNDGLERPIAYISRSCSAAEKNYTITKLELLAVVWACRTFRPYILLRPFLLGTDHGSLRWLMNFKNPTGQTARWLSTLAEFHFTVQHRPELQHGNADGLSRQFEAEPSVNAVSFSTPDVSEILQAQQADADIHVVVDRLAAAQPIQDGDSPVVRALMSQTENLALTEGVLYRETLPSLARQLVVPAVLHTKFLNEAHAGRTSGHFGQDRTLARLRSVAYWPGMSVDVALYCKSCTTCERGKDPPRAVKAPLGTIYVGAPFEVMAMDIMGPLPLTARGNKYVLVVADSFSKWVEIIPLPDMKAETVADRLVDRVFLKFGVPCQLHSDQGPNFESRLISS